MSDKDASNDVISIIKLQNELEKQEQEIQQANPEFFAKIKAINEAKANVDNMWEALKQKLIDNGDFDVHEVSSGDYKCRYSVSKTVKIVPNNIDEIPEEFVETKKVVKDGSLKKYYELYGKIPSGCVDKSFYRLNKKISEENNG